MLVVFRRATTGITVVTLHRDDNVVLQLPGYDRKYRVPHDLAHFATERALGITGGVFGSIAAGGTFSNMRVLSGRPRHDAASRSKRILDANRQTLTRAEVLAGVVHHTVETNIPGQAPALTRRAWGVVAATPFPWTDAQVTEAAQTLSDLADDLAATGTLRLTWPPRLTPAPHFPARGVHRGRRGRT